MYKRQVDQLAKLAAEYAVLLAKGQQITGDNVAVISNENYTVPYVKLEPVSVTEDNIDDIIIADGFHLKEDVYLNVPAKMPK